LNNEGGAKMHKKFKDWGFWVRISTGKI